MMGLGLLLVVCVSVQANQYMSQDKPIQYKICSKYDECTSLDSCSSVLNTFMKMDSQQVSQEIKDSMCQITKYSEIYVCCPTFRNIKRKAETACGKYISTGDTTPGKNPWYAQLIHTSKTANESEAVYCNGVLISRKYVLTVDNCLDKGNWELTHVRLGDQKPNATGCTYCGCNFISKTCNHSYCREVIAGCQYSVARVITNRSAAEGLALLRLRKEVLINSFVPVCLPSKVSNSILERGLTILTRKEPTQNGRTRGHTTVENNFIYKMCGNSVRTKNTTELCILTKGGLEMDASNMGSPLLVQITQKKMELVGVLSKADELQYKIFRKINSEDLKWIREVLLSD